MSARADLVRKIDKRLGRRALYWFGIRGDDARSLAEIPQFAGSFSITNRFSSQPLEYAVSYEQMTSVREDMDTWDIDEHAKDIQTKDFRHLLLGATEPDCAIVAYRPCDFLSSLAFARQDRCDYLGMHAAQQRAYEHKPAVETALLKLHIPTLDWQYVADEEQREATRLLDAGPVIVRPSRGSGGVGMALAKSEREIETAWPRAADLFASISRYRPNCLPLNIGAVVWDDGVTIHQPSVQLVGLSTCTERRFGYCGNDFALAARLDKPILDQLERHTTRVGKWLRGNGYRGAFGLDLLVDGDNVLFTELNPRFQGSTRLSCRLDAGRDEPCLVLDHVAALLHVAQPQRPSLAASLDADDAAQVVLHNLTSRSVMPNWRRLLIELEAVDNSVRMEIQPEENILVKPAAVVAVLTLSTSVTTTGYDLSPVLSNALEEWTKRVGGK